MPDVCVINKCNNKCIMCTNPDEFVNSSVEGNYDLKTQIKKLSLYIKGIKVYEGNKEFDNYINLTGGEPTIHKDFFKLIYYFRKNLPHIPITLLTNARKFKDERFTIKFSKIAKQPFSVAINFPSSKKEVFENITGIKGSFSETLNGIKNLMKYFDGEIEFRIVLIKQNYRLLKDTLIYLWEKFKKQKNWRVSIIHYEIEGKALKNHKKISVKLSQTSKELSQIKKLILSYDHEIRLYHYPLCVVDKELRKFCWITLPKKERIYTQKCKKCIVRKNCLGLMLEYYKVYGDYELKPIVR